MKLRQFFRTFMFATLICGVAASVSSCKDDEVVHNLPESGTITGTVSDEAEAPLGGVTVTITGGDLTEAQVLTTSSDGTFSLGDLKIAAYTAVFSKKDYQNVSVNIAAGEFVGNGVAVLEVTMPNAPYQISGTVTDGNSDPLGGVSVKATDSEGEEVGNTTTGEDGTYAIDVAEMAAYELVFSKEGYVLVTENVVASNFVDRVATVDVELEEGQYSISGVITDGDDDSPLQSVTVVVKDEGGAQMGLGATSSTGAYEVLLLGSGTYTVNFSKDGYQSATVNVAAADFSNFVATVSTALVNISYKITGEVVNDSGVGVWNVAITATDADGNEYTATSAEDGTFVVNEIPKSDYALTFVKVGYDETGATANVAESDFDADKTAALSASVNIGTSPIVLPSLTYADLLAAPKLYYNWYRGGNGGGSGVLWDWSTNYAFAQYSAVGTVSGHANGFSLTTSGSTADENNFQAYIYGSKKITEENKIMSVKVVGSSNSSTSWGVQVVDLSAAVPAAVKALDNQSQASSSVFTDKSVDLSAYVGKEIIIAVGVYNAGTTNRSIRIRNLMFSGAAYTNWDWPTGGTPIPGLEDWQITKETIASTMVQEKTVFSGYNVTTGGSGDYLTKYRANWYDIVALDNAYHFGREWSFVPVVKDAEPMISEGFMIKTHKDEGDQTGNSVTPHAYGYAKFAITEETSQMTFWARTFGGRQPYFKVTAIAEDGESFEHLVPATTDGKAGENGAWKLTNDNAAPADVNSHAKFVYDLSSYVGKNIVIAIGVYTGTESKNEEYKLVWRKLEFGPKGE